MSCLIVLINIATINKTQIQSFSVVLHGYTITELTPVYAAKNAFLITGKASSF